jgi:filamentous hemagglutinin family protein
MGTANRGWRWGLVSGVLGLFAAETVAAQPIPDETLGAEQSRVRAFNAAIDLIEGGATRDRNLFHSFQEFNIGEGRGAYFLHQLGIENIFSRVTGDTRSEINGVLGVLGVENGGFVGSAANLFLINPNGIVFGPNSSLDVGGSFVATTGDGVQFGDRGVFSATDPEAPSSLLTVNPSAVFFNQLTPAPIVNQSRTVLGTTPLGVELVGLNVSAGESLLLLGGDILMDGGINAAGGRVEIGGLAGSGRIELVPVSDGYQLQFSADAVRSNVFLSGATINVAGSDGGNIAIYAQDLTLTGGSFLRAGYEFGFGTTTSQAGDITLDATGAVLIDQSSTVANIIRQGAIGNGGDINVNAGSLVVRENGQLGSVVNGQGTSGNITINVRDRVEVNNGFISNGILANASGTSGDVTIEAGSITISNASFIDVATFGQGNSGNITLTARGPVALTDGSTVLFSNVLEDAVGNGGTIAINAESVSIRNGARLDVSTNGRGNAGNIQIAARETVTFDGASPDGRLSYAFSRVAETANGNGGTITIAADSIFLRNGAQLRSDTDGQGDAGSISLTARDTVLLSSTAEQTSLIINGVLPGGEGNGGTVVVNADTVLFRDDGRIITGTQGIGNGGNVAINAGDRIEFQGEFAGISTTVSQPANGNAGDVTINTGSLLLFEGAGIFAGSLGQGDGGDITITAREAISLDNALIGGGPLSAAVGRAGNITIRTGTFSATNQFGLSVNSAGQGDGGNIEIVARDAVSFSKGASAQSGISRDGIGNAGDIIIRAGTLSVTEGSQLATASFGQGNAGDIRLRIRDTITLSGQAGGLLTSLTETGVGRGGDISIRAGSLFVSDGASIITSTTGRGSAGNVAIAARDRVVLDGSQGNSPSGVYSTVESTGIGTGGTIRVAARSVAARNGAQFLATTFGQGDAGNITINATDTVSFDGRSTRLSNGGFSYSGAFSTVQGNARGNGRDIQINTGTLSVTNGARVSAATLARGRAGNLLLNARDAVIVDGISRDGFSSGLFTSTENSNAIGRGGTIRITTDRFRVADAAIVSARTLNRFSGGNIEINANSFAAIDGGQVLTTTNRAGRAGDITVNADRVLLSGTDSNYRARVREFGRDVVFNQGGNSGLFANTRPNSTGDGGRITVNSSNLTLQDAARISAQSQGTGTAGDIDLNASEQLQLTDSDITTTAARSSGGDIEVNTVDQTGVVILRGDSDITTNSQGNGGNITLRGSGIIAFDDSDILARSQDARGGNITLDAFFSQSGTLDSEAPFDGNDRVDVNADGEVASGTITTPDTSVIQNSLTELPETAIDPDTLVADSCVVRSQEEGGTFTITGAGGLPQRPGDRSLLPYGTSPVRSVEEEEPWQPGEAIVEPQGVYQLEDGRMVLSRECES